MYSKNILATARQKITHLVLRGDQNSKEPETDIYACPENTALLKADLLAQGCLVDDRSLYRPHSKFGHINDAFEIEYLDVVSQVAIFDKSRGPAINTRNFSATSQRLPKACRYVLLILHVAFDKPYNGTTKYHDTLQDMAQNITPTDIKEVLEDISIPYFLFRKIEQSILNQQPGRLNRLYKPLNVGWLTLRAPRQVFLWLIGKLRRFHLAVKRRILDERIVVFMGTDGSGKTTMIETLQAQSKDQWHYIHLGNKSTFLPTTRLINRFRKQPKPGVKPTEVQGVPALQATMPPTAPPTTSSIVARMKEFIYNTNFKVEIYTHIQYLRWRNILTGKKSRLFVDRYIYDRFVPGNRLWGYGLFPRPDLIVLMDAPVDVLLARKQEHSAEVLESFKHRYHSFLNAQKLSRALVVDSTRPIEKIAPKLLHIIERLI